MQKDKITVDIVSDVACPWCYIGKRRLEAALAEWKGAPVEVSWHPFQLDPTIPKSGFDRDTYLINKFGDLERTREMTERITDVGLDLGLDFNFGKNWMAVNTLPLHQLLHVAGEEDFKDKLKERFLYAYFTENLHLNDPVVLNKLMSEFGWDAEKTQEIIANDDIAYAVKQEIGHYQQLGVSGVPFFIINNKYGISGAQPSSVFLEAFQEVAPINGVAEADSCGPDGENC
ncbi:DsbA family oxidoreductase [Aggregatimonas sangjinii]|uniref:DsbA family oxidoreductase n=1 Tax=Aggregatimonas sangjinii TaxID=2583587 RepID=A0A5B7SS87_9FLAO|nr:DsbA family oxidoreductase [Aggregatimonas sangjinii]QCX01546.1 DsbA family oxidoreductase [Aggregatimonas sangjinii]